MHHQFLFNLLKKKKKKKNWTEVQESSPTLQLARRCSELISRKQLPSPRITKQIY